MIYDVDIHIYTHIHIHQLNFYPYLHMNRTTYSTCYKEYTKFSYSQLYDC